MGFETEEWMAKKKCKPKIGAILAAKAEIRGVRWMVGEKIARSGVVGAVSLILVRSTK